LPNEIEHLRLNYYQVGTYSRRSSRSILRNSRW